MTNFWLAVVAMLTGVAGFMFWPLIALHAQSGNAPPPAPATAKKAKPRAAAQSNTAALTRQAASHQQRNIDIFKERLSELEAEKTQGTLDTLAFEQLKLELEKSLLNDVTTGTLPAIAEPVIITAKHWLIALLMTLAVIIWSISLYAALGRSDDYSLRLAMQAQGTLNDQGDDAQAMATTDQNAPDLNKAIELLKEKVKQDPKNIGRWFLLANSYAATQQYAKSAETFLEIEKIVPKDSPDYPSIKGSYAQALYLANDEKITEPVKVAIAEALRLDPNEPNALVLKGVESYEQAAYKQAIGFWEQAKTKANPNLIAQFIDPSISAAQAKLGITAPTIANKNTSTATVNTTAKIQVTVDIAPELKSKVSNDHVVFVFARPANSKMPLAAERLTVKDLPATITLDDSKAAMPTAKLSSVANVDVIARISLSGQAIPQDGDLFATQEQVNVNGSAPIRLLINQVVGATTATAAAPTATATLRLTVDIAPELKAKVSPEQTVFIFAKPQGGKMPLAVERLTVKDLPANVVLDDSKAAMPTATLSSVETVDLTARISLSGQAIAQAGDLFANQEQVNIKQTAQPIQLLINQVMP
jgi:cytochrome c-type biogenesis protein CcmH